MLETILNNIVGEAILLIIVLVISIPFAFVKILVQKKLEKDIMQNKEAATFTINKKVMHIIAAIVAIVFTVSTALILYFCFAVTLEEDLIILLLLTVFIGSFMVTETIFTLFCYFKIKKENG